MSRYRYPQLQGTKNYLESKKNICATDMRNISLLNTRSTSAEKNSISVDINALGGNVGSVSIQCLQFVHYAESKLTFSITANCGPLGKKRYKSGCGFTSIISKLLL